MAVFYEAGEVPVHSCLMMPDERSAAGYPRRALVLGFCRDCGFISNVRFDPQVHEYAPGYEDQQSFSPRFRAFQTELVQRLVERYGLRDRTVLEIGCSKGDFLIELCRAGGNRGIGIDPSCVPGRVEAGPGVDVRFIAEHYSPAHGRIACDAVCCRHTLEHIHQTADFVGLVRESIGDRHEVLVFFEVPDVGRVLRETAFWDMYYEHCSYFTLGSLARLFRANGFEVLELCKDYDDQYLLLVARPANGPTTPSLPEEDDLAATAAEVEAFRGNVQRRVEALRDQVRRIRSVGKKAAIWGSGSKCVSFLSTLGINGEIECVVDINPYRHGKYLAGSGRQVVGPEALRSARPDVIFVMNPIYRREIAEQVAGLGIEAELVAV